MAMLILEFFLLFCIYVCGFNSTAGVIFVWLVIIPKLVMVVMTYYAEKHPLPEKERIRHNYKKHMTDKYGKLNWNDPKVRKMYNELEEHQIYGKCALQYQDGYVYKDPIDDEYWSD